MRRVVALFVALVALAGACSSSGSDTDEQGRDGKGFDTPTDGDAVPDLSFERLDGSSATLRGYEGKPLVINFFGSWCEPCAREMPGFEALHRQYGDEITFLGLAVNDRVEDAQGLVDRTGVTYDLGLDPKSEILTALDGVAMPTTVLVSADGVVVGHHTGELKQGALETLIEERLYPG